MTKKRKTSVSKEKKGVKKPKGTVPQRPDRHTLMALVQQATSK